MEQDQDFVKKINQFMDDSLVVLRNYFSGQISVAIILGLFYAVSFKLIGLSYALVLGVVLGLLTFIPLIGPFIGFLLCMGLALYQLDGWVPPLLVFSAYVFGQLVESYYLTPKYIGKKTGMSPLLVFVSILLGGALFGIIGMVLAVPVALIALLAHKYFGPKKEEQKLIEDKSDKPEDVDPVQ